MYVYSNIFSMKNCSIVMADFHPTSFALWHF